MANYYVATNGNNGNPGTIGQPWRDIQYGYDQISAGDILHIRGGTYNEVGLTFDTSGASSGNELHIRAYNPGTPETVILTKRLIVETDWHEIRDLEFVTDNDAPGWNDGEITVYSDYNSFLRMHCHDYDADLYGSGIMLGRSGMEYAQNNTFLDTRLIWSGSIYFTDLRAIDNLFIGGEISYSEGMFLRIGGATNTVDGFEMHDAGQVGTDGDAADGVHFHGNGHTLKNCQIYRNFRWAAPQHVDAIQWWTNTANPTVNDILIENCRIGSTETGGMSNEEDGGHIQWTAEDTSSDRVTVRNCVFLGTAYPYCFSTSSAQVVQADDWVITGNIFRCPEGIRDNTNAEDWTIRNNVFYHNGTDYTNLYDIDYNVYVNSNDSPDEGTHSHEQISDPKFVDDVTSAENDYGQSCDWHLEAGSICIDAGDADYIPTLDPDNNSRYDDPLVTNIGRPAPNTYWDIAIYEYQGIGGTVETLQGTSDGTSTATVLAEILKEIGGSTAGGSTASASVDVSTPGIETLAGQSDGGSSAGVTLNVNKSLGGQSDGTSTVSASLTVTGGGGQTSATLLDDNYLAASGQSTNNGTSDSLFVYRDVSDTSWCRLSILRFDFTDIPDGSTVTVADLGIFLWDDPQSGVTMYVRHMESVGQAFTEYGSCWDTYDGTNVWDSGDFSAADWTTVNQASDVTTGVDQHWMNFDIVAMVQHALDSHSKVLEIVLTSDANDDYFDFNSLDYGEDIPYLDITYTGGGPTFKELAGTSDGSSTAGLTLDTCVEYRVPTSDDAETDGTFVYYPATPTTVWDKVDDSWGASDDDSTYVIHQSEDTCYAGDAPAFSVPSNATITDLRVQLRHKKMLPGLVEIQDSIKVGGTWYDSTGYDTIEDGWTTTYSDYANNPDTSQPWTVDQINGVGGNALDTFGWYMEDADPDVYFTQVILRVRYTFGDKSLAGTSDGTSTATATQLKKTRRLTGTSDGTSTVIATVTTPAVTKTLAGTSAGTSTANCLVVLGNLKELAGQADGVATVTGTLKVTKKLIGTSDGSSTATATLVEEAEIPDFGETSELFRTW
jgi:hypothetical protein